MLRVRAVLSALAFVPAGLAAAHDADDTMPMRSEPVCIDQQWLVRLDACVDQRDVVDVTAVGPCVTWRDQPQSHALIPIVDAEVEMPYRR